MPLPTGRNRVGLKDRSSRKGGTNGIADKLDEIKAGFKAKADPESLALMDRATRELGRSDILDKVIRSGDRMPDFILVAARGGQII